MEFYARDPSGVEEYKIDVKSYTLNFPLSIERMEYRTLDLEVSRKTPISQFCEIRAYEGGKTVFRGYNEFPTEIRGGYQKASVPGVEKTLLDAQTTQFFLPMGEATLDELLSDTLTEGSPPGLLAQANSLLPPGTKYTVYDAAKNIIKLEGMGLGSSFANRRIFVNSLNGVKALSQKVSLAILNTNDYSYFQDATDLYVRIDVADDEEGWPDAGGLLIENGFDTTVRLGTISKPEYTLKGDLQQDETDIGNFIVSILTGHGFYLHKRYDSDYLYLDVDEEVGRGYPAGLYTLDESEPSHHITKVERVAGRDPEALMMTGKGYGGQRYSRIDPTYRGRIWTRAAYELEQAFKDSNGYFIASVDDKYTTQQKDYSWKVSTSDTYDINLGDYIRFIPRYEDPDVLQCTAISMSEDNITTYTLGTRPPRFVDAHDVLQGSVGGYTDRTLFTSNPALTGTDTCKPSDPAHDGTQASISITTKSNILDSALLPRVTLDLSVAYNDQLVTNFYNAIYDLKVNGTRPKGSPIIGYSPGQTLRTLDITDQVTAGAANTITLDVTFQQECTGTHTSNTGHPDLDISATMNFLKRLNLR